ncbi:MAG: MBL fold metallo-hydrolase [Acidobacteriota bacterium]
MSSELFLEVFAVGPIQANCVLLGDRSAGELVVIDPGEEAERIVDRIRASDLKPTAMLHTHGHLDHVGGTANLARLLGIRPVACASSLRPTTRRWRSWATFSSLAPSVAPIW